MAVDNVIFYNMKYHNEILASLIIAHIDQSRNNKSSPGKVMNFCESSKPPVLNIFGTWNSFVFIVNSSKCKHQNCKN